jgi:adenylate cyclase
MVLVDDATLAAASKLDGMRWPFPRFAFAGLIAALDRAGAARIVMDFTFFEESDRAEFDLMLAGVAAAVPSVVLGRTEARGPVFWNDAFIAANPARFERPRAGGVDFLPDDDGVVRRYAARGSLAALAFNPPVNNPGGLLRWHGGLAELKARGEVPILSAAPFVVRGNEIIRRLSQRAPDLTPEQFARALAAEPPLDDDPAFGMVRGRTVFLGANASGTFDVKPTPVGHLEPGTLLHWTAWANLASGGFITALPRGVALGLAALTGCAIILAGAFRPGLTVPSIAAVGLVVMLLVTAYAGMSAGWFLSPASPIAAATLTLLGVATESFWTERRRKREIQAMFGSYVDPGVVALLLRDPTAIRLGGERRPATVYFSDLASFTDLSEKIPPEELVGIVNLYLQEMSDCLTGYGAYIDKYIGDAVMAVFGAPQPTSDHALAACRAALAARRVLEGINRRLVRTHGYSLGMRTGINTGEMIVGNVGSERKRNYTVLGDAVNLASRLEAANKEFGTEILLGENTARAVQGVLATRPLTLLRVKGKREAIEVHELVGVPSDLTLDQNAFLTSYREGYDLYARREFDRALPAFRRALAVAPTDRVTLELLRRAGEFVQAPPAADWQPILTLETK